MAKQTPILKKTFPADTAIASANLAVVASGTNAGNVKLPAAALATKFIGVTDEPADANNYLSLTIAGIAQIQTDGSAAVTAGDYVAIANSSGQIKSVTPATGTNLRETVGIALNTVAATAGLLVDVLLQPTIYIGA